MEEVTYFEHKYEPLSEEEEFTEQLKPKRRRLTRVWLERGTYSSPEEAEEAVNDRKIWKISSSSNTPKGKRVEYRCTAGKYRIAECAAGLYLLYHNTSNSVSLYETNNEHSNHVTDPTRGLSADVKMFVQEKYMEGITKPNAILNLLRRNQMAEPDKSKLITFLRTLRLETLGGPTISAAEIRTWCEQRKESSSDLDEPYVLDFNIHSESYDTDEQDLKIVLSTPRLLSLATKSHLVQTDATYKLNWQGYPFLVVGTSDANHVFHPTAVAITKGETQDDFTFVLRALHAASPQWKPSVLLAAGSEAITNAFISVFDVPKVRLVCFLRVMKNVEKYLRPLIKEVRQQLKEDISLLQTCLNEETFLKASALFLQKWRKCRDKQILDFIEYFEREWLVGSSHWYEGAAVGLPSTNNGIETMNATIRKEHTLRERLPVRQFLTCIVSMVKQWSQRRDPTSTDSVFFADSRSIPSQLWTQAYQWAAQQIPVLKRDTNDCNQYFIASSKSQTPITAQILTKFECSEGKWTTFEDFSEWRTEVWKVEFYPDHVTCTCPFFAKNNQCKHSVGMQIRRKEVEVPLEVKTIPLDQKRKRGRPLKAKKALLV